MIADGASNQDLTIAAYTALKAEQASRIGLRDNYTLTYAGTLAVLFAAYSTSNNPSVLLAVPAVAFVGLHTYKSNDHRIETIREFLKNSLPPSLAKNWESTHQLGRFGTIRAFLRLVASLLLFLGPAVTSYTMLVNSQAAFQLKVIGGVVLALSGLMIALVYRSFQW